MLVDAVLPGYPHSTGTAIFLSSPNGTTTEYSVLHSFVFTSVTAVGGRIGVSTGTVELVLVQRSIAITHGSWLS
jgi:hypothetical protein